MYLLILFTSFFSIWVSPSNFNLLDQPIQNVVYCYIKYNVSSTEAKLPWHSEKFAIEKFNINSSVAGIL